MLDLGTLVTAVVVVASPFIFMGYVKFLVRRAEAHATKPYKRCREMVLKSNVCLSLLPLTSFNPGILGSFLVFIFSLFSVVSSWLLCTQSSSAPYTDSALAINQLIKKLPHYYVYITYLSAG